MLIGGGIMASHETLAADAQTVSLTMVGGSLWRR